MLLLLPDVPVEALRQGGEPVRDLVLGADRGNGVDGTGHAQAAEKINSFHLKNGEVGFRADIKSINVS